MLEVIATEREKSRLSSGAVTAWIDSELVRTTWPRRSDRRGRAPECLQSASSWLVPSGARRDHHSARRQRALAPAQPGARVRGGHDCVAVGAVGARPADGSRSPGARAGSAAPSSLGEPQVVLDQRVLGAVAAPDHAAAAAHAARAGRSLAVEVGVVDLDARLAEVHPHAGLLEGLADAQLARRTPCKQLVRRGHPCVVGHAEHPLGRVVVGRSSSSHAASPSHWGSEKKSGRAR